MNASQRRLLNIAVRTGTPADKALALDFIRRRLGDLRRQLRKRKATTNATASATVQEQIRELERREYYIVLSTIT